MYGHKEAKVKEHLQVRSFAMTLSVGGIRRIIQMEEAQRHLTSSAQCPATPVPTPKTTSSLSIR